LQFLRGLLEEDIILSGLAGLIGVSGVHRESLSSSGIGAGLRSHSLYGSRTERGMKHQESRATRWTSGRVEQGEVTETEHSHGSTMAVTDLPVKAHRHCASAVAARQVATSGSSSRNSVASLTQEPSFCCRFSNSSTSPSAQRTLPLSVCTS